MKRILIPMMVCALSFVGCKTTEMMYQISTVTPLGEHRVVGDKILFENEDVACWYDYWNQGGSTAVEFQNKTDADMILSLPQCCYTINDNKFPFYSKAREIRAYEQVGVKVESKEDSTELDLIPALWQLSDTLIGDVDPKLILLPALSTVMVEGYEVNRLYFDEEGLRAKPKGDLGKTLQYTRAESPFEWENELVYFKIGQDTLSRLRHQFYISQLTNLGRDELYQKVYARDTIGNEDTANFSYYCPYATPNRFYVQYNPDEMPRNYSARGVLYLGGLFLVMSMLLVVYNQ